MEEKNKTGERRKFTRVVLDAYITATLTIDKAPQERLFMSKDIGPEGIFLVSRESFPLGTILNLKIHTPTTLKPIDAEAKVIRIQKEADSRVMGMGLVLIQISETDKKELFKHLYLAYHYLKT